MKTFFLNLSILLTLSYFITFVNSNSAKLNVPRVLLPIFNDFSTNFTLEVSEHGCYRWTSSRLDIIQIIPLDTNSYLGCSSKAIVSTISKERIRNTVIVLAEDVSNELVLRCDIIVDIIHKLNIVTTTREVYMEEAPEMFEVRAYDDQGNQFSTLEGIEFHWSIIGSMSPSKAGPVLKFITFHESPYETPLSIAKFDKTSKQGHIVLIEGITTGIAKVSVSLPHKEYNQVPKIEVQLSVVANLLLDPPDSYIIRGDKIKYKLLQMQQGKLQEIPLPSIQYYLEVENKDIIELDSNVPLVRGLKLGQTKIILHDRNVDMTDVGVVRLPTATITVTEPAYLSLVLLPYRNWAVLVNEICSIVVEVFDSNNHKINIGDAVQIQTTVPDNYFSTIFRTNNGTLIFGKTIQIGTAPVIATLESVRRADNTLIKFHPPIFTQADMFIYPRIVVIPGTVILPWDPVRNNKFEVELKATGGDGSYWWNSGNNTVASVSQGGIVRAQNFGETKICATMQRNQQNQGYAIVQVLPPVHLEIVGQTFESEILKPITVHLALFAEVLVGDKWDRKLFTNCQNIEFKVKVWDKYFYHDSMKSEPIEGACGTITVIGKKVGTTKVSVSYEYGNVLLEASTTVSAFNPLEVLHPVNEVTVLAVGTSRHLVWTGGPKAWFGRPSEHTVNITSSSNIVTVNEIPKVELVNVYVYSVTCIKLGEAQVKLSVVNSLSSLSNKAKSSAVVKVICAKPKFITLQPELLGEVSCPLHADSTKVIMLSYSNVLITVLIKDEQNRVFDNATSLHIDWNLSKKNLGTVHYEGGLFLAEKTESNYILPLKHYQTIIPKNHTGTLQIVATVSGYKRQFIKNLDFSPEYNFGETNPIETTLSVVFVNDTIITPDQITVFNHPQNKVTLKVSQGSGYHKVEQSSTEIADVRYTENTQTIEILPKSDGILVVTLLDLCLPSRPAIAEIQVLKVGSMRVDMLDRVEKSNSIIATVWLYDSVQNTLAVADSELLELRTEIDNKIVSIKRLTTDTRSGEVKFEVTGIELGNTDIVFISGNGIREIRSQPQSLQVFPPLQLVPHNITLIVGATFQISSSGGPQPDCNLEFLSLDSSLVKVNSSGLVEGIKLGVTQITGMAVGYKKNSKVIYTKDSIVINVLPLDGVKIHSPLTKIRVGSKMPIWVKGVPDKISPLILGSVQPNMLFKWSLSSPDIAQLQDILYSTGVEVAEKDRISMRFLAVKPGRVTINLLVILRTGSRPWTEFSDSIEVEVFERLDLIKPVLNGDFVSILMAPDSKLQLRTNKESVSGITYTLVGSNSKAVSNQSTALSRQGSIITVSQNGLVVSRATLGHSTVLINAAEENGVQQTIAVHIEVKPVQYLMLNVKTKLHINPERSITALPRGLDLELSISYHDNQGTVFTAVHTDLKIKTNRMDKVHLKHGEINGTLYISLADYGQTMLKVWDGATPRNSEDYFKLNVDHLISPAKSEMTVGDIACFSMPLLTEKGESGIWSSANPDIITMDLPSGVARARSKTGSTLITYSLSKTMTASTLVEVLPIHSISFLSLEKFNLTNWGQFTIPLILFSERDTMDKTNNLLAQDGQCHTLNYSPPTYYFPFSCEIRFNSPMTPVDVHSVFIVYPHFSIESGLYSCRLEPVNPPSVNTSILLSNVTLRVISDHIKSDPLVLPFLPALFVHTTKLHLSDKQMSAIVSITGIPAILSYTQVYPSDPAILSVSAPDHTDVNSLKFQVRVNEYTWSRLSKPEVLASVFVLSPLTNQNITINVIITLKGDNWLSHPCLVNSVNSWTGPSSSTITSYFNAIVIIVSIVVIALASMYVYATMIQPKKTPNQPYIYGAMPNISPTGLRQLGCISPNQDMNSSFLHRQAFSDIEPVYGDPSIIRQSPERLRRKLK
uniref:BIG2 domain-containing protein n=1 Tax=Clastoptera arizonana TaxID=38151 RepID=A0A1B6DER5_9HEMI